jgi:hypothetical protein
MAQTGPQRLGNPVISTVNGSTTQVPFPLRVINKDANVEAIRLLINATVVATATAGNININGSNTAFSNILAIEGTDDYDRILNSIFSLDFFFSPSIQNVSSLSPSFLRGPFSVMNRRDFDGPPIGTSIATGAGTAMTFNITIPISLRQMADDFRVFRQGGWRFDKGQINFIFSPTTGGSFTGTTQAGNAYTIAPASVSVSVVADLTESSYGGGVIGPLWEVKRSAGNATVVDLRPLIRLGCFDMGPSVGLPVTSYNLFLGPNQIGQTITPQMLDFTYKTTAVVYGNADPTTRMTPLYAIPQGTPLTNVDQSGNSLRIDATTASASLTLTDLTAHPPSEADIEDIAQNVAGGGMVGVGRGLPPSMWGTNPSPQNSALLPIIVCPPALAAKGWQTMAPRQVATYLRSAINIQQAASKSTASLSKLGGNLISKQAA